MHVSKVKIVNVRGVGSDGLEVDFAKARGERSDLAGWTVIAGRNGFGKSTILQCIAASLIGPAGGPRLIGPNESKWFHAQAPPSGRTNLGLHPWGETGPAATTTTWVVPHQDFDGLQSGHHNPRPIKLQVDWLRGGGVRTHPPAKNYGHILTQFWMSNDAGCKPDGWVFLGYGPHRSVGPSVSVAPPRMPMNSKAAPESCRLREGIR